MTQETKVLIGIVVATILILVGAVFLVGLPASSPKSETADKVTDTKSLYGTNSPTTGTRNSKVTIVEFGDFQCPACGAAEPAVEQVLEQYKDKITFIFRNFPLTNIHQNAMIGAEAAMAAGEQGKFWEMYQKLYENQREWSESNNPLDKILAYAKDLKLDTTKFEQEVKQKKYEKRILSDQSDGMRLGVNSTPTFFINGQRYPQVLSFQEFKSAIEAELKK